MKRTNGQKGITLVALVITIIILLILATISIQSLTNTGLFAKAKEAKEKSQNAEENQEKTLNEYEDELNKYISGTKQETDWTGKVNKPKLMTGMTAIKFNEPTGDEKANEGSVIKTTDTDTAWYDYDAKKWANAQTQDGSMWVWIPRFAYRVNKSTQTFDVVFLEGTTDYYYENGEKKEAKRQKTENETVDTTTGYTVHPAFTNESSINYVNGGWDKELTGIWVAKFEAGYASGNNSATVKESSVKYTEADATVSLVEKVYSDDKAPARNYLDGKYGVKNGNSYTFKDGIAPSIKYPTFQGLTYSMNYISHSDAFNISKVLTENGNIYGLNSISTDSHMLKNSEWGAVAYLSQSKYGLNGTNIYINNVNLNNTSKSVYAVTGCAGTTEDANTVTTTITEINDRNISGVYVWTQKSGTKASTTGTIYGIYDISGGTWERTTALLNNGNTEAIKYIQILLEQVKNGKSSKYVTVYPYDSSVDKDGANTNEAGAANWKANTKIYGDGIRETSTAGIGNTSWYGDFSYFPAVGVPSTRRGGDYSGANSAGLLSFTRSGGDSTYYNGFRSVLVVK
jgi:Tfp pilus assembly protein PilE